MARRVVQQTLRAYNIGLDVLSVQLVRLLLAYVWKETRDSLAGIQHTRSVAMTTSVESFFPGDAAALPNGAGRKVLISTVLDPSAVLEDELYFVDGETLMAL
ncbi:hypothetical protein OUZ56_028865 [Daphnia magna]|uniref:Uncharacterized protein n=1 Tax=Daphnia magna TaxID=35525 RepID=A0ABR0B564_9CRUS|nr:hypothetical protein OUZ56_028865 [Daphnia magna]